MTKSLFFLVFILSSINFNSSFAAMNVYTFKNIEKKERFNGLIAELRCPKCQNNNLADSNAPLATDIKDYVYNSITKNKTDNEIREFLISRYGEFVTYKPLFSGASLWVWLLPLLIVISSIIFILINLRMKRKFISGNKLNEPIQSMQSIIEDYDNNNSSNLIGKEK